MDLEIVHIVVAIVSLIATGAAAYLGMVIRNEQTRVQLALSDFNTKVIEGQHELREDFNAKHGENSSNLKIHVAQDDLKFDSISRTMTRIENKLDDSLRLE